MLSLGIVAVSEPNHPAVLVDSPVTLLPIKFVDFVLHVLRRSDDVSVNRSDVGVLPSALILGYRLLTLALLNHVNEFPEVFVVAFVHIARLKPRVPHLLNANTLIDFVEPADVIVVWVSVNEQ